MLGVDDLQKDAILVRKIQRIQKANDRESDEESDFEGNSQFPPDTQVVDMGDPSDDEDEDVV